MRKRKALLLVTLSMVSMASVSCGQSNPTSSKEVESSESKTSEASKEESKETSATSEAKEETSATSEHTHSPSSTWENDDTYHWHTCSGCDEQLDKEQHNFVDDLHEATYEEGGYTIHTCSVCGYYYRDGETGPIEGYYRVELDAGDGHFSDGENYKKLYVKDGEKIPAIGDPTRDGYCFDDWLDLSTGKTISIDDYVVTGNVYFCANWINEDQYLRAYCDTSKGSINDVSGYHKIGEEITLTATPNDGYAFEGWYVDNEKVSSEATYTITMPRKRLDIEAKFEEAEYVVTVLSNEPTYGSISGGGSYKFGSSVTVVATPTNVASFTGWYDEDGNQVSNNATYTFTMPSHNYTLTANFVYSAHTLTLTSESEEKGSVSGAGQYNSGTVVTAIATPATGYYFTGWYKDDDTFVSGESEYRFIMPDGDYHLTAKFSEAYFSLTVVNGNSSLGEVNKAILGEFSFEYKKAIVLTAYPGENAVFVGWYDELGNCLSTSTTYTYYMQAKDTVITARWASKEVVVTAASYDETKGTVSGSGTFEYGSTATLVATPKSGSVFLGWFIGANLVSRDSTYTTEELIGDLEVYAMFDTTSHAQEQGFLPTATVDEESGETTSVSFGLYPQTKVSDETLIDALDSLTQTTFNGYYEYDGNYYLNYNTRGSSTSVEGDTFTDGTAIEEDTAYWFKVEPIEWNVLKHVATSDDEEEEEEIEETDSNELYLFSKNVIEYQWYGKYFTDYDSTTLYSKTDYQGNTADVYPNNYKYSDIRTFLNEDFFNIAFMYDANIIASTIDNSASTTISPDSNSYACEDTVDKVSLISYQELIDDSYGFSKTAGADAARQAKTTDFALAKGAGWITDGGYCEYMTRSPGADYNQVSFVGTNGWVSDWTIPSAFSGIRPTIHINKIA